ncbi:hypothetical protein MTO96_050255 [Rhipicephalus appendiculatus]
MTSSTRDQRLGPWKIHTGLYSIMDPEAYPLRKEQLPEQEAETEQANHWMSLYLVSLLAAALGLIICLYLLRFVFANDSSDVPTTTQYLIEWMRSLNLDLMNETILAKVNPIEIMVRGSLDLGVHVVLSIEFREKDFLNKKRVIEARKYIFA